MTTGQPGTGRRRGPRPTGADAESRAGHQAAAGARHPAGRRRRAAAESPTATRQPAGDGDATGSHRRRRRPRGRPQRGGPRARRGPARRRAGRTAAGRRRREAGRRRGRRPRPRTADADGRPAEARRPRTATRPARPRRSGRRRPRPANRTDDAKAGDADGGPAEADGRAGEAGEAGGPVGGVRARARGGARPARGGRPGRHRPGFLGHEWTLAALGSLAARRADDLADAALPARHHPAGHLGPDACRPGRSPGPGTPCSPTRRSCGTSNAFFPEQYSFAFSDTLLGYAPAGMIGTGPVAAVRPLQHHVRAGARARRSSGRTRWPGSSARAGPARRWPGSRSRTRRGGWPRPGTCTCSPSAASRWRWRCSPAGTAGRCGTATGRTGGTPGWALAGWLVAAWQISLGFGIGLPFAYVLAADRGGRRRLSCVPAAARRAAAPVRLAAVRRRPGRRGSSSPAVGALMALPYFKVAELHPYAGAAIGDVSLFSPPLTRLLHRARRSRGSGATLHAGARGSAAAGRRR